jgi:hypothetical protein
MINCGAELNTIICHYGPADQHVSAIHGQLKPFRCGICDASFGRKGVWKKHIQMVHEGQRKFECDVEGCNHSFGLKSDLKRHTQSVHLKQCVFIFTSICRIKGFIPRCEHLRAIGIYPAVRTSSRHHYRSIHVALQTNIFSFTFDRCCFLCALQFPSPQYRACIVL